MEIYCPINVGHPLLRDKGLSIQLISIILVIILFRSLDRLNTWGDIKVISVIKKYLLLLDDV